MISISALICLINMILGIYIIYTMQLSCFS